MPPCYRLQVSVCADNTLPQDRIVMTPHFTIDNALRDPQELCEDLAVALATTYWSGSRETRVTAYDAQGTPPVYPVGEFTTNVGLAPVSTSQRETALCLSFFSERNVPRQRGRLYVPTCCTGISSGAPKPSTGSRDKVAALVPILTNLGGGDVDWCVYSRVDDEARSVTNWWVDDAWDTVRSRGLAPTTRTEGTTSEM